MELLMRAGIACIVILGGIATYIVWTRLFLVALRGRINSRATSKGLENLRPGVPAILYFTSPDCAPCRTMQIPAINSLLDQFGDRLQLIKIDATERTDVADFWGVLSVPTTFIIDAKGQPRRVNHGVAPAAKLRQQLREIGATVDARAGVVPAASPLPVNSVGKISTCEEC